MKKQLSQLSFIFLSLSLNSLADTIFVARNNDTSVEITYTIVDNSEITINRIDPTATGDLVIPDTIEGLPVTKTSVAFYEISLTSLTLPETLTALGGRREFWKSYNLVTVIMPGVTRIVSQAFSLCNNLETVICSPNLTAVDNNAFQGCEKISIVILPASAGYGLATFYQSGLTELHLNGEEPLHPYNYNYGAAIDNGTTPSVIVKSEYASTFATDANGLWNRERGRGQGFVQTDMLLVVGEPKTDYGFFAIDTFDTDTDGDSVVDVFDNAPLVANTDQLDTDGDSVGDVIDNAPLVANTDQLDTDGDSVGDVVDNAPLVANTDQLDTDGDSVGDVIDNAPLVANTDQLDTDGDSVGDVVDTDDDGDGVADDIDNAPLVANTDQLDTDNDGVGDVADTDDDGDGVEDVIDNAPLVANPDQLDWDYDGVGDVADVHPGYNDEMLTMYLTYNNYVKTSEIIDARAGSTLITVSNGVATVELEMEQSDDLQTWSEIDGSTSMDIPADASVKFFRFKMAD